MPALFPTTPPPTQPPDWPRPRRLTWRSTLLSLLAAGSLLGSQAALAANCSLFNQTTAGIYTCEVDPGYTSLDYVVTGANGGGGGPLLELGGKGASIRGTLSGLTPGQTLWIAVGGDGADGWGSIESVGSGGGGYSAISTGDKTGPLVVAGGGGGEGDYVTSDPPGGAGGNGGTTNAGGGGAGGTGGAYGPGSTGGVTLSTGGVGGTNPTAPNEFGGAGGALSANGGNGVSTSGGGGAGFGGTGGLGAGFRTTLGGTNGGGGGGYGAGGGGGGWGGGGGGAGNPPGFGGGGGGGGSSLVPTGAVAVVSTGTALVSFTLPPAPTVTAISPPTGPTTGNQPVTITGTTLTDATAVTIGGAACTLVGVPSATSLTCTTTEGPAGPASVLVTTPSGTNGPNTLYTYVPPPTVTAIAPATGPTAGGQPVTITGANLTGATGVTIGGATCGGVSVVSSTSLTCTTGPHAAGAASVLVSTIYGSNAPNTLYTYGVPPTVTAIAPPTGRLTGGQPVTITGTDLTGATGATIGGAACTLVGVPSATSLTCTTPAGAVGAASVVVTTPFGANGPNALFTYVLPPTVTLINPARGPTSGGQRVTITGTNLNGATVTIGAFGDSRDPPCTLVGVPTATSLTCQTPAGTAGPAFVRVITNGGEIVASQQYTYADAPPTTTLPIPTLSGWAQLILVSLLFGIAAWYRRTRA